jgi:16S rRNA G966 N2-methylase RsmD
MGYVSVYSVLRPQHVYAMRRVWRRWLPPKAVVVDGTAHIGVDSYLLHVVGATVYSVEIDAATCAALRCNLSGKTTIVLGDIAQVWPGLKQKHPEAILFLDPPWDGPHTHKQLEHTPLTVSGMSIPDFLSKTNTNICVLKTPMNYRFVSSRHTVCRSETICGQFRVLLISKSNQYKKEKKKQ